MSTYRITGILDNGQRFAATVVAATGRLAVKSVEQQQGRRVSFADLGKPVPLAA